MFTESDESADEKPEHPNLVLEGLLNLADEFAKTLPELPDNANRKREQCVERLQIRSDVFDAMIEKARAAYDSARPDIVDAAAKLLADMEALGSHMAIGGN